MYHILRLIMDPDKFSKFVILATVAEMKYKELCMSEQIATNIKNAEWRSVICDIINDPETDTLPSFNVLVELGRLPRTLMKNPYY
jgi:hypothetical protein